MMSFYCPIAISQPPCPGLLHYHHQHHILPNSPTAPTLVPASVLRRRRVVDARRTSKAVCGARRRVRHDDDDEDDEEEYGHNEEIAMLERYSEWAQDEALLVNASVDDDVELVLVFKGFSSSLSGRTASDPARSVLPERAIIQSIDVVKGPFDPNNVEYLEKGLTWKDFKSRLQ